MNPLASVHFGVRDPMRPCFLHPYEASFAMGRWPQRRDRSDHLLHSPHNGQAAGREVHIRDDRYCRVSVLLCHYLARADSSSKRNHNCWFGYRYHKRKLPVDGDRWATDLSAKIRSNLSHQLHLLDCATFHMLGRSVDELVFRSQGR